MCVDASMRVYVTMYDVCVRDDMWMRVCVWTLKLAVPKATILCEWNKNEQTNSPVPGDILSGNQRLNLREDA